MGRKTTVTGPPHRGRAEGLPKRDISGDSRRAKTRRQETMREGRVHRGHTGHGRDVGQAGGAQGSRPGLAGRLKRTQEGPQACPAWHAVGEQARPTTPEHSCTGRVPKPGSLLQAEEGPVHPAPGPPASITAGPHEPQGCTAGHPGGHSTQPTSLTSPRGAQPGPREGIAPGPPASVTARPHEPQGYTARVPGGHSTWPASLHHCQAS